METDGLPAILIALGTFIGGLVLAWRGLRGDRFQRKVTESAALLTGYTEMVSNLRKEITAIQEAHEKEMIRKDRHHKVEIENMVFLHNEERIRWEGERDRKEVERERMVERIELLEAQVAAVLFRPPDSKGRATDDK